MPGKTDLEQAERRQRVEELEVRGLSALQIAAELGADVRTIRADIELLAQRRANRLQAQFVR